MDRVPVAVLIGLLPPPSGFDIGELGSDPAAMTGRGVLSTGAPDCFALA